MPNDVARAFWKASNAQAFGSRLATDPAYAQLNTDELSEISALLPDLTGQKVLELGAGIGRFTSVLAGEAANVDAVDICHEAIELNQTRNRTHGNIKYLVADVMDHSFGQAEYDLIFCNWLLMYLDDADAQSLLNRCASGLKPQGKLFIRESCRTNFAARSLIAETLFGFLPPYGHQTYNLWRFKIPSLSQLSSFIKRSGSLQEYRDSQCYGSWFERRFSVERSGHLETYVRHYDNPHQKYWLMNLRNVA